MKLYYPTSHPPLSVEITAPHTVIIPLEICSARSTPILGYRLPEQTRILLSAIHRVYGCATPVPASTAVPKLLQSMPKSCPYQNKDSNSDKDSRLDKRGNIQRLRIE